MPEIQVDEHGVKLFYLDSGVPTLTDRPYTTLVMMHGFIFNNHIFTRLLSMAAGSHIRLILVNRRGYHGSTPLTESVEDSEQEYSDSEKITQNATNFYTRYLKKSAVEIATFLVKLIEIENIPPPVETSGRVSGGLSLLAWSLGNIHLMAFMAFANTLKPNMLGKLTTYLRKLVIYDAPYHSLGYPTPPNEYIPYRDQDIPESEREIQTAFWLSGYYTHSPKLFDLDTPVSELPNGLLEQRKTNPAKPSTLTTLSPEDFSKAVETLTKGHGDLFAVRSVHRDNFLKALFKSTSDNSDLVLPNTQISYIWCTEAFWQAPYGVRLLKAEIESPPPGHSLQRPIKFFVLEGENHMAHWDNPLKALAMFAQAIEPA